MGLYKNSGYNTNIQYTNNSDYMIIYGYMMGLYIDNIT